MKHAPLILIALLLGGVGPAALDPHPLSDGQLEALKTAGDNRGSVNEAAFIALLKNAQRWSDTEAGAMIPDHAEARQNPSAWRGQRCLIEGELFRVLEPQLEKQGRTGWEKVQGLVLRVDHSREKPLPEDFVIVYLTDPPEWRWRNREQGLVWEAGSRVRVVARFYKVARFTTQRSEQAMRAEKIKQHEYMSYLAFVGRTPTRLAKRESNVSGELSDYILVILVFLAVVGYLVYRGVGVKRRLEGQSRLQEYIKQRQAERESQGAETEEEAVDPNLPDDPIEALEYLARRERAAKAQQALEESEAGADAVPDEDASGETEARVDTADETKLDDEPPARRVT